MKESTKIFKPAFRNVVVISCCSLIFLVVNNCRGEEEVKGGRLGLSAFLRRLSVSESPTSESPKDLDFEVTTWRPKSIRSIVNDGVVQGVNNATSNVIQAPKSRSKVRLRTGPRRRGQTLQETSNTFGVDRESKRKPEELIRTALINHTLEHGGEEDLDKLVFSTLPQGSKLILRTVRIIKTDENGEPVDESESKQPTYWDVTLANATDQIVDDEEGNETSEESDEDEENGPEVAEHRAASGRQVVLVAPGRKRVVGGNGTSRGRKKSDLQSSGSHSSENYHLNNDYGTVGRDKEHGKTHYHGNSHGKTHKQTYTVTDGKDVKPYEGTEKGVNEHAHSGASDNKNQGERFKSSKRKNKGRKVTGFKRVYHKEEFQRTEHFYDDEEAKKIAESFGLSEAKESNDEGTKGDKRKYHGVRTEYLDGKKHENEHGTRDGYDKGQRNTYKDSEKHSHKSNYGKSMSQHHNNDGGYNNHDNHGHQHHHQPHHHQQQQQQQDDYHPNHNYDASYSSPKKSTISHLPTSITDKLEGTRGGGGGSSRSPSYSSAAIISAPIATSFTVREFSPIPNIEAASTPTPTVIPVPENAGLSFPPAKFAFEFSNYSRDPEPQDYTKETEGDYENDDRENNFGRETHPGRRHKFRKEPREKKIFFSPKHREVKEDDTLSNQLKAKYTNAHFQPVHVHTLPYQVILPTRSNSLPEVNANPGNDAAVVKNNDEDNFPFAPNFATQQHHLNPQQQDFDVTPGLLTHQAHDQRQHDMRRPPKSWLWHRRRQKRPRPTANYPENSYALPAPSVYPMINQVRLTAIPLRHMAAYHRLGNRLRYHPHRPNGLGYVEMSTRKSDEGIEDSSENEENQNSTALEGGGDSSAHFFNHNHRYAKNHLTSTIHPLPTASPETATKSSNGVRNTLFGSPPGVYSTIIKVLPATMLNMNGSHLQQGSGTSHTLATAGSGSTGSATKRPQTYADLISITTAFPSLLPQPQQFQPQQFRPFLPRNRLPTFDMNHIKHGSAYQHPFSHTTRRMPNIIRGIRNGIVRTFRRGTTPMLQSQPPMLPMIAASPTAMAGSQATQLQKIPAAMAPYLIRSNPYYRQMYAQFPVNYGSYVGHYNGGILPLGSRDYVNTVDPPTSFTLPSAPTPAPTSGDKKPKFYYALNASVIENKMGRVSSDDTTTDSGSESRYTKSSMKIASVPTLAIASTPTAVIIPTETGPSSARRKQTRTAPTVTVTGPLDSASGFLGSMG